MTEKFINIIDKRFDNWSNNNKDSINMIDYNIKKDKYDIDEELYLLMTFLRDIIGRSLHPEEDFKNDKYPILCYLHSVKPSRGVSGRRLSYYDDYYCSLENRGYILGPSDYFSFGKKREKFREKYKDSIIYAPTETSFYDMDTFYIIQALYVREALKTNQDNAQRLVLSKYKKRK